MKNLNITITLTCAGGNPAQATKDIDGPVIAVIDEKFSNMLCGIAFILAIAGKDDNRQEPDSNDIFDFDKTYDVLIRLTDMTSGRAVDLYSMIFEPKQHVVENGAASRARYCYTNEIIDIQDIYFPLEKQKAKSRYVLKALVRQHDMDKPKWFIQNMTPVRFEKSTAIQ